MTAIAPTFGLDLIFTLLESSHPEHVKQWSRQQKLGPNHTGNFTNWYISYVTWEIKKNFIKVSESFAWICFNNFVTIISSWIFCAAEISRSNIWHLYIMPSQNLTTFHVFFRSTSNKFDTFDLIIQRNKL